MSGGKPVLVSDMDWPMALTRLSLVQKGASGPREETPFSRRSRTLKRAGQVRLACSKDSDSFPQRGHDVFGFWSNQERWVAR